MKRKAPPKTAPETAPVDGRTSFADLTPLEQEVITLAAARHIARDPERWLDERHREEVERQARRYLGRPVGKRRTDGETPS